MIQSRSRRTKKQDYVLLALALLLPLQPLVDNIILQLQADEIGQRFAEEVICDRREEMGRSGCYGAGGAGVGQDAGGRCVEVEERWPHDYRGCDCGAASVFVTGHDRCMVQILAYRWRFEGGLGGGNVADIVARGRYSNLTENTMSMSPAQLQIVITGSASLPLYALARSANVRIILHSGVHRLLSLSIQHAKYIEF